MLQLRPFLRPALLLAIVVAVVALPTAASSAPGAGSANSQTFTDSTGENPAAPDITTIVVSNDDAGTITFRVNTPNKPAYSRDVAVFMFLDSDSNQATGDPESLGADFLVQLFAGEIVLLRWDGTDLRPGGEPVVALVLVAVGADDQGQRLRPEEHEALQLRRHHRLGDHLRRDDRRRELPAGVGGLRPRLGSDPRLLQLLGADHTADARRTKRHADARPPDGRQAVHDADGRRALGHRRGAPERPRDLRRSRGGCASTASVARVQGGAVVCTWLIPANAKGKTFRGSAIVVFEGLKATRSSPRGSASRLACAARALSSALAAVVASTGTASGRERHPIDERFRDYSLPARPARETGAAAAGRRRRQGHADARDRHARRPAARRGRAAARASRTVGARQKLNLRSSFCRSRTSRGSTSAQQRAIARLREQIPEAKVSRRYRVLLNGFAVSLPYAKLPRAPRGRRSRRRCTRATRTRAR